jgi:electron transfer flavoprotein beta subunit
LGNVVDYSVDLKKRTLRAKRLVRLQGFNDVIEEVEANLPVFIAIDPAYKPKYGTVSQRLAFEKFQKEAKIRSENYKQYLKVFNAQQLGVDPKLVGLPGSPTIVYKVERVPKGKATRKAEVLDGSNPEHMRKIVAKINEALSAMVIK